MHPRAYRGDIWRMMWALRVFLASVVMTPSLASQRNTATMEPATIRAAPGSTLTIRGSTTIGARWSCTARDVWASALAQRSTDLGADAVRSVTVIVPVRSLKCQSGPMDRAMLKAMRADAEGNNAIVGSFTARPTSDGHPDHAHLDGSLTVAGVEQSVSMEFAVQQADTSTLRVQSSLPLTLSQFRIVAPRVLFGAVRARDAIAVEVNLLFPSGKQP